MATIKPGSLLEHEVLWPYFCYQYLAEGKIVKHRLSTLRLAPLETPGSSKAYRSRPHSIFCKQCADSYIRDAPRHAKSQRHICLVSFRSEDDTRLGVPRPFLKLSVRLSVKQASKSVLSRRSADKQMIDNQLSGFAMGLGAYLIQSFKPLRYAVI